MYKRSLYSGLRGTALFLNIINVFIEYLVLTIRRYLYLGTLWYQHVPKYKESLELNINNYVPEYKEPFVLNIDNYVCLLYTSPSPRDGLLSRMPSSA